MNKRRDTLQTAYAAQWHAAKLDAILCPVNPSAASAHGESKYWGYSSVFNMLDYSAAVFPVGKVMETDDWAAYPRASTRDLSAVDTFFRTAYTGPGKYREAPVSLQLVTRRLGEERLLLMVDEVVKCLKN
jgi:amidase